MNAFYLVLTTGILLYTTAHAGAQDESGNTLAQPTTGAIVIEATTDNAGGSFSSSMQVMSFDMESGPVLMGEPGDLGLPMMPAVGGDSFAMLNNPSVQKDLELVDDQVSRLAEINAEFSAKMQEQMGQLQDDQGRFNLGRAKELGELIRALKERQKEEIDNILLPHQQDRLKQVSTQMQMKSMGTARALSGKLAKKLGITQEQKKRLQDRQKELQATMDKKMAELKANAKKELLKELTAEQRQKLKELTGDDFEMKTEDFQRSRGGRRPSR